VNRLTKGLLIIILGLVCLVALPDTPVLAGDDEKGITASVTVLNLIDITVTPVNQSIAIPSGGTGTKQFYASGNYTDGTDTFPKDITSSVNWTSSNTTVATIDASGLATALAAGTTTISASLNDKTDNTTLTVTIQSSGGDDGGGGGGGGGGSSDTTSLSEYTTSEGKFVVEAVVKSADGKVWMIIPKNTVVWNRNGQRLRYLSIKEKDVYPNIPANRKLISLVYDIGPNGSTFRPPVYLVFKYSDALIPVGIKGDKLVIATVQDDRWVEIQGCTVDTVEKTIKVLIGHLSIFAVMARTAEASFEINEINITPSDINPDEPVNIGVTITNNGDMAGSKNFTLKVNDEEIQTQTVTLDGGGSLTISFTMTPGASGEYTVDVDGIQASFTVNQPESEGAVAEVTEPEEEPVEPARFDISDLSITPSEVYPTGEVTISTLVQNVGGSEGSYDVVLKINGIEEARKSVTLGPGASETLSFTATGDSAGDYNIDINGRTGKFVVNPKPPATTPAETEPESSLPSWLPLVIIFAGMIFIVAVLIVVYRVFYKSR